MDELLTTQEAAKLLDQHPVTLARWRQKDFGPSFIQKGRYVRYRRSDIDAWLQPDEAA